MDRRPGHRFNRGRVPIVGGGSGSAISPLDPLAIVGGTALQFVIGDVDLDASGWADQSGNGHDYTVLGAPAIEAAALNGRTIVNYDGTDDGHTNGTLDLPAPGTTPTFIWGVMRQDTRTTNDRVLGGVADANLRIHQGGADPNLVMANATAVNTSTGGTIGSWFRFWANFTNTTGDELKAGAAAVATGGNAANNASTGRRIGCAVTTFADVSFACLMYRDAKPAAGVLTALDAWVTDYYGATVLV